MERTLTINQQIITLTIVQEIRVCTKCQQASQIRLLAHKNDARKGYCQACSLNLLDQLEQSSLQFTSKEIIIKELRTELNKWLWANYYVGKKPTCPACVSLEIKDQEYKFCGENCLVSSWIEYHGHNYLAKKTNSLNYESF